ncbi:MAG: hypothetical protein F4037_13925, partial [Gemmatimonadales bacterium]|nr:hypothetical protein [Candidatus Palauibacter ramosifaciens]
MWRRRCATCATRTSRGTPADMPTRVVMAQLSPTMEEGKLIEWKVAEGDAVAQGDVVAEIETDKANMDVEALGGGVLRKIVVQAGATVPVGALIGVIAEPDEAIDDLLAEAAAGGEGPAEGPAEEPAAPAVAPESAAPVEVAAGPAAADAAANGGTVAATPGDSAAAAGGRIKASPVARRMAAESGIALAGLAGSGPGGRIVKSDVEAALARGAPGVAPVPAPT